MELMKFAWCGRNITPNKTNIMFIIKCSSKKFQLTLGLTSDVCFYYVSDPI